MSTRSTNVLEILETISDDFEVDDFTILHEGWRRFEKELEASIADLRHIGSPSSPDRHCSVGYYTTLDRLEAVGDLHRLLRSAPERVAIDEQVSELLFTLARCSHPRLMPPVEMDLVAAPVDGRVCRGINLMLVALIAGELAGGPIHTDGHVEIEVTLSPCTVDIRLRDLASDPPDRVSVGGRLLERVAKSLGATVQQSHGPGIATVAISVPLPSAFPWRTVGNA